MLERTTGGLPAAGCRVLQSPVSSWAEVPPRTDSQGPASSGHDRTPQPAQVQCQHSTVAGPEQCQQADRAPRPAPSPRRTPPQTSESRLVALGMVIIDVKKLESLSHLLYSGTVDPRELRKTEAGTCCRGMSDRTK